GCFSLYANKIVTSGEGGVVVTADTDLADRMMAIRNFGQLPGQHFLHAYLGGNYKMMDLSATIGCVQLGKIDAYIERRRLNVAALNAALSELGGLIQQVPSERPYARAVYFGYHMLFRTASLRQRAEAALHAAGVETRPFFSLITDLAGMGVECHIPLAQGKPHDRGVSGWTVHPVWPPKGLRWYIAPFVWPRAIKRVWDAQAFDLLRAHSVRFIGPAALLARRRYRLPVPVVTHHHHLDPSPLNPFIEKRVLDASDRVITDSEFARRQLADELGLRTDHVTVVYCGVGPKYAPTPKEPSLLEGCPLAPQEAMSCGKPVVAFRVASLGEMVDDGKSGFLVARNDRSAFVERVLTLLRDRELLARFGAASAERVDRNFRWDMTVRRVLEVYQEVVDGFR